MRKHRDAEGLTTQDLATLAGFLQGSEITRMEQGHRLTLDNLDAVARALDIGIRELLP